MSQAVQSLSARSVLTGQQPIYRESQRVAPWQGWLPLIALPAAVVWFVPREWPRWAFMWSLAIVIYAGFKWLTWRRTPVEHAPWWRHAGYLLLWPGMDAAAFLGAHGRPPAAKPSLMEWAFALAKLAAGVLLLLAVRIWPQVYPYFLGWAGMIGLALVLHFGLFHLLSCGWRALGVDARPLMNWPTVSESVGDYWGRRWNTAFRDLAHRFLFRPVSRGLGMRYGLFAGFVFSGVLHDLVISLPVRGGYGGPTAFFTLQGVAMLCERSRVGRRMGLGRGLRGWLFTALAVVGPAYLLFHPPFVLGTVVPFLKAIGVA